MNTESWTAGTTNDWTTGMACGPGAGRNHGPAKTASNRTVASAVAPAHAAGRAAAEA